MTGFISLLAQSIARARDRRRSTSATRSASKESRADPAARTASRVVSIGVVSRTRLRTGLSGLERRVHRDERAADAPAEQRDLVLRRTRAASRACAHGSSSQT